jgi:hypothetical protein
MGGTYCICRKDGGDTFPLKCWITQCHNPEHPYPYFHCTESIKSQFNYSTDCGDVATVAPRVLVREC